MIYSDYTLTSPLSDLDHATAPLLAVTILWHPDPARIGEQFVGGTGSDTIELNRYAPLFMRPGSEGLPLGHGGISRQPLRLVRDAHDTLTLALPASSMVVEVGGRVVKDAVRLTAAQVAEGQVLTLGRAVVLCLHWMDRLPKHNPVPGLHGVGSASIGVRDQLRMVAPSGLPVLLLGETGTGKEIAARAIHALSSRAAAPLVTVNMAALGEATAAAELFGVEAGAHAGEPAARDGVFAQADRATLFLDEIGNAPAAVQPMLLRVLEGGDYRPVGAAQDRRSSARVVAASDQDLEAAVFNQALLHRLEGFVIRMPPLRTRREDIGVLIVDLLGQQEGNAGLPAALVAELACWDWPGNVRQLSHVLQRAVLMLGEGVVPTLDDLVRTQRQPPEEAPAPPAPRGEAADAAPRRRPSALSDGDVLDAMAAHDWNIQAAAQALRISRPSLYKLLEDHPVIRRAETIPENDIARAMEACGGDVERCAATLKTPAEALRRRWRLLRPG
ncbi:sigma-54-dependent transcriptional regulator [Massilia yuzhufengensis]|uniref:Two-component system, NtrC family, nitrogen regulation response regulator GlnG n=1 Tax=Massilia yuzhufengensis TaxID=1164594 RepID=A0A1I1JYS5_9BURK|nr:sigma 54-interacting transcriptional regulator [Massilia yuzhufengensis]SFC53082.1 two-component system, NtrC family, nitrogen regulation response regulator GlnG [Massilia yuzhufengensis]